LHEEASWLSYNIHTYIGNVAIYTVHVQYSLQHYGARPIRRWLQKNVMTKLSEMLFKGEIDADTAVIIDACDKKCLNYEVVKNVPTSKAQCRRLVVEIPSDSDSDDDGVELTDPIAKK
jgi:hypothetical protein